MNNKRLKGNIGEDLACQFLKKQGYKIIERNFYSRVGEIDIVAIDPSTSSGRSGDTLVFVEVKTRWSKSFGEPAEAVTPPKLKSIVKTAWYYKLLHPKLPDQMRIDVVTVDISEQPPKIELIKNISG